MSSRGRLGGLSDEPVLPNPEPESGGGGTWSWLPLALMVLAGAILGGLTLHRILQGRGSEASVRLIEAEPGLADGRDGLGLVLESRIADWIERLSSTALGGRDAPSPGLDRAQEAVAQRFRELGLAPAPDAAEYSARYGELDRRFADVSLEGYLRPFPKGAAFFGRVPYEAPDAAACELFAGTQALTLGRDYVPLASSSKRNPTYRGEAFGEAVFAGYGIDNDAWDYDDFDRVDVRDRVAVILAGEPNGDAYRGRFEDDDVSAEASVWNKIDALAREGAAAAIVVMPGDEVVFRHTRAFWNPPSMDKERAGLPTLVVTESAATVLLGEDVGALREEILASGQPAKASDRERPSLSLSARTVETPLELRNVVGYLPGDANASYVILGAHLDHIGVGPRGRVGRGADDNASGIAALLEAAAVLSSPEGRERLGGSGVLFCAFTGEEDGLVGSRALASQLPLPRGACVGMINLDMVGRGPDASIAVLGITERPRLAGPVERALRAGGHGFARVKAVHSPEYFQRSDHFSFHEVGIPALFLFEDWPHEPGIYHTWLDTPDVVSPKKVAGAARLAACLAFALAR